MFDPYSPAPPPPLPGPPPNNNKKVLAIVLPLGVLLLIAVIVGLVVVGGKHRGADSTAAGQSTTSAVLQPPGTATAQAVPPPTVPGWQVIASGGVAVDIPRDWKVDGTSGTFDVGACGTPTSFRAKVSPSSDPSPDVDAGAKSMVNAVVQNYYSNDNPQITFAPPKPTTDGKLQDYKATVALTPQPGNSCDPPLAIVHVIAAKGDQGGTYGITIVADQQIAGAEDEAILDQIAMTTRATN